MSRVQNKANHFRSWVFAILFGAAVVWLTRGDTQSPAVSSALGQPVAPIGFATEYSRFILEPPNRSNSERKEAQGSAPAGEQLVEKLHLSAAQIAELSRILSSSEHELRDSLSALANAHQSLQDVAAEAEVNPTLLAAAEQSVGDASTEFVQVVQEVLVRAEPLLTREQRALIASADSGALMSETVPRIVRLPNLVSVLLALNSSDEADSAASKKPDTAPNQG